VLSETALSEGNFSIRINVNRSNLYSQRVLQHELCFNTKIKLTITSTHSKDMNFINITIYSIFPCQDHEKYLFNLKSRSLFEGCHATPFCLKKNQKATELWLSSFILNFVFIFQNKLHCTVDPAKSNTLQTIWRSPSSICLMTSSFSANDKIFLFVFTETFFKHVFCAFDSS
jgi:hypothetical protein